MAQAQDTCAEEKHSMLTREQLVRVQASEDELITYLSHTRLYVLA
jgi:hypothetical protein